MTQATATTAAGSGDDRNQAAAVEVAGLTHHYPPVRKKRREARDKSGSTRPATPPPALDRLSFAVQPGEIFGILGPNGSGKTTLFRILCTLLRPREGTARIFGHDVLAEPQQVRRILGVVFQMPSLDIKLTANENLMHQGRLYGLRDDVLSERVSTILESFGLAGRAHEAVERFSGGMRRRVEVAKAMLHQPRLLIMDEPATGLDVAARIDLWRQLELLRRDHGVTIVLTTHLMEEADRCDRLLIMSSGRSVALDTPESLKRAIGGDVIVVEPRRDPGQQAIDSNAHVLADQVRERFGPWGQGGEPAVLEGRVHLEHEDGPAFVATLADAFPERIASITVGRPTLEDVFLQRTGRSLEQE